MSESGFYSLVLRSDKPQAKPFRKWVTSVVLPAIRKTGSYATTTVPTRTGQHRLIEPTRLVCISDLVFLRDGIPVTSSIIIAQETRTKHYKVTDAIFTWKSELLKFGNLDEEQSVFYLNGFQSAYLLITILPDVRFRNFKWRLLVAFYDMATNVIHSQTILTNMAATLEEMKSMICAV